MDRILAHYQEVASGHAGYEYVHRRPPLPALPGLPMPPAGVLRIFTGVGQQRGAIRAAKFPDLTDADVAIAASQVRLYRASRIQGRHGQSKTKR
jgi:hypothetical protein